MKRTTRHWKRFVRHGLGVLTVLSLTAGTPGCGGPKYDDLKVFLQSHRHDVAATNYRLEPPDTIVIDSPTSSEIDQELQRIRSDGKISLRLLGEVQISGMTPEEASATLEELLSKYYESPQAIVRVVSFESKHIRISGQVRLPGNYPFTGRDTVLDLIASAHPTFLAWGANVKVIRPNANPEERHEIIVDIDKMLRTGDTTKNFLLQEGDMVYVPPTPLGWVGLRFQELLFPISPALSLTNSPVQLRNTSDDMQYGNINNASEYRERRGWR